MTAIHIPRPELVPYKCKNKICPTEIIHFDVKDKVKKDCPDCGMPLKKVSIIHLLVPDKERMWIINCEEGRRNRVDQWALNRKDAGPDYPFHCTAEFMAVTCYECLQNFDKLVSDLGTQELQKLYEYVHLKTGK